MASLIIAEKYSKRATQRNKKRIHTKKVTVNSILVGGTPLPMQFHQILIPQQYALFPADSQNFCCRFTKSTKRFLLIYTNKNSVCNFSFFRYPLTIERLGKKSTFSPKMCSDPLLHLGIENMPYGTKKQQSRAFKRLICAACAAVWMSSVENFLGCRLPNKTLSQCAATTFQWFGNMTHFVSYSRCDMLT